MFDQLLEEDPWVKEKVAEGEAKGEAKGKAEGRTEGASKELVRLVQGRYPALLHLAKARATKGEPLDVLDALIEQLWASPDEQAARTLLETYAAS
jgi:predicted transposase YdaD